MGDIFNWYFRGFKFFFFISRWKSFHSFSCNLKGFICNENNLFKFSKLTLFLNEYNFCLNQECIVSGVFSIKVVFFTISDTVSTLSYFRESLNWEIFIFIFPSLRHRDFQSCKFISNPAISWNISMISFRVCLNKINI